VGLARTEPFTTVWQKLSVLLGIESPLAFQTFLHRPALKHAGHTAARANMPLAQQQTQNQFGVVVCGVVC
jgi:hypothetical protein